MISISNNEARFGESNFTHTRRWIITLTEFRNSCDERGQEYHLDCLDIFGRRVVGELGYAALLAASILEGVVFLAIGVLGILLSVPGAIFCCSSDIVEECADTLQRVVNNLDTSLRCLVGLVKNIWRSHMEHPDLAICEFEMLVHSEPTY